jgi:hypothetical protein
MGEKVGVPGPDSMCWQVHPEGGGGGFDVQNRVFKAYHSF